MARFTLEIGNLTAEETFTAQQAENFLIPFMLREKWQGPTDWSGMTDAQRQTAMDFVLGRLRWWVVRGGGGEVAEAAGQAASKAAAEEYAAEMGPLLNKPVG